MTCLERTKDPWAASNGGWLDEHGKKGWQCESWWINLRTFLQIIKLTIWSFYVYNYLWLPGNLNIASFKVIGMMSHPSPHVRYICGKKMMRFYIILVRSPSLRLKWVSCQHWHRPSGVASNPWGWYQNSECDIIRYIKPNWRKDWIVRCQNQENFQQQSSEAPASMPCLVSWGALRDTDCDSDEDSLLSSFESDDEDEDEDDDEEDDDVEWEMGTSHVLILAQRRVLNVERDTSNHVTFQ